VPITHAGRFAGVAIMFTGIAILGVLSGSLAALFHLDDPSTDTEPGDATLPDAPSIHAELVDVRAQLQTLQLRVGELAEATRAAPRAPD
jgi:hypothetical protein